MLVNGVGVDQARVYYFRIGPQGTGGETKWSMAQFNVAKHWYRGLVLPSLSDVEDIDVLIVPMYDVGKVTKQMSSRMARDMRRQDIGSSFVVFWR